MPVVNTSLFQSPTRNQMTAEAAAKTSEMSAMAIYVAAARRRLDRMFVSSGIARILW
jgi:hypothetical protein